MSGMTRLLAGLCAITALGGCMDRDPYRRTDVWRPTGANAANIAAMAADPKDMIRGHGTNRVGSNPTIIAIDRVQTDNHKRLPNPGGGSGGTGGGTGTGAGAGAGAGTPAGS